MFIAKMNFVLRNLIKQYVVLFGLVSLQKDREKKRVISTFI